MTAGGMLVAFGLTACATVTRGTSTSFIVASEPRGAAVKTSTGFSCPSTPCTMKMPRKKGFDVTVSKDGFEAKTMHVSSKTSGAGAAGFVGNAVLGGFLGMALDATNGSMNDLSPNPTRVILLATAADSSTSAADIPPDVARALSILAVTDAPSTTTTLSKASPAPGPGAGSPASGSK
jgi:hypothetical protein